MILKREFWEIDINDCRSMFKTWEVYTHTLNKVEYTQLHRADGPARIGTNHGYAFEQFFVCGMHLTKDQFMVFYKWMYGHGYNDFLR